MNGWLGSISPNVSILVLDRRPLCLPWTDLSRAPQYLFFKRGLKDSEWINPWWALKFAKIITSWSVNMIYQQDLSCQGSPWCMPLPGPPPLLMAALGTSLKAPLLSTFQGLLQDGKPNPWQDAESLSWSDPCLPFYPPLSPAFPVPQCRAAPSSLSGKVHKTPAQLPGTAFQQPTTPPPPCITAHILTIHSALITAVLTACSSVCLCPYSVISVVSGAVSSLWNAHSTHRRHALCTHGRRKERERGRASSCLCRSGTVERCFAKCKSLSTQRTL